MTPTAVNSGARLDRLPISAFHWRILLLIAAGGFVDAFDVYLSGSVMAAMARDGFSDLARNAYFASATFTGMLIGAGTAGLIGDQYGRRYSYQTNLLVFGLASLAACFAPNIETLIVLRFIQGLGLGAELVIAAGTLCEFIPPSHRGRWGALLCMFINTGLLAANGLAYLIIPSLGWRAMFAVAGVGALLVWIARKSMPESPRWLESVGRVQEAEAVLRGIEAEVAARHGTLPAPARVVDLREPPVPLRALFTGGMGQRTLVAALFSVAYNIAVYGFIAWLPTFLVKQGLTVVQSLGYTTLMSAGAPLGALFGFLIIDRMARKTSVIAMCLLSVAFGLLYPMMADPVAVTAVGFGLVSSVYAMVAIAFYGYVPELFPTSLRLRGAGFANMWGRATSIGTPYVILALFAAGGLPAVLGLVVAALLVLVVAVALLPVEMARAPLEESGRAPLVAAET